MHEKINAIAYQTMKSSIPAPVIAVLSEYLHRVETNASLDNLFMHADATGEPLEGSKLVKVQAWLKRINDVEEEPLAMLGKIFESYIGFDESSAPEAQHWEKDSKNIRLEFKAKLIDAFARTGLRYHSGTVARAKNAGPL